MEMFKWLSPLESVVDELHVLGGKNSKKKIKTRRTRRSPRSSSSSRYHEGNKKEVSRTHEERCTVVHLTLILIEFTFNFMDINYGLSE